ncbi:hypothetical protein Kvar_1797 [Klebsiella variicola At-22]|uniref:hypothetical protein n=1 Tax=Klebsiella variicola TaxID=244366 RepID=UPI0001BDD866|nr:hypothetical protein [Klebsiella variicola]ADC57698.1 hypothetical protein Kvar_1797 [Klebsiella variicola At-22]
MSLQYKYFEEGIEVIPFGPTMGGFVEPQRHFNVSGEQKEVHAYLEAVSSVVNTKFSVFYDMRMESRIVSGELSDAMVNLVFCFDPTNALDEDTFKEKFILPFRSMFV